MNDTTAGRPQGAGRYDIRLQGHLAGRWAARLDGMTLTHGSDGTTLLSGEVTDQAALHGLLNQVRDLGVQLLSVTQVAPAVAVHAPPTQGTPLTKETTVKLTGHNLIRLGGVSAALAGICYVGVGLVHPANVPSSVTTTPWAVAHVLACAACCFALPGMAGIYARQAGRSGRLGLVGYVLLSLWFMIIMGFSFVEAFILPQAGTVTPAFVEGWMGMFNGTPSTVNLGVLPSLWTLTAPLYILGGLSFGIATFRARILPRGAAVLLAAGTALAPVAVVLPLAAQPKTAVPVGLALAWLGWALLTERRTSTAQLPERALAATA